MRVNRIGASSSIDCLVSRKAAFENQIHNHACRSILKGEDIWAINNAEQLICRTTSPKAQLSLRAVFACSMSLTTNIRVHLRQLALQSSRLQILRRSRRPLLRCLEQARRSALEDYIHRIARMGARVLIN